MHVAVNEVLLYAMLGRHMAAYYITDHYFCKSTTLYICRSTHLILTFLAMCLCHMGGEVPV